MGYDTNLVAFDRQAFHNLESSFQEFLDTRRPDALQGLGIFASQDLRDSIEGLARLSLSTDDREKVVDLGCRLFFAVCAPVRFSFTGSSLSHYFYERSERLRQLFCSGGLEGRDMNVYLGPDSILLFPNIARELWTEIENQWPIPDQLRHPGEVIDLNDLAEIGSRINRTTFENLAVAYY